MEDRQSPRHLRVQEPGAIRHASGLLLDRRPRSRTGNRSPAGIRKGRPARVESACRRLAFRQVQPDEPEAGGFACRTDFDFPVVDKERTWRILEVMAPIAKAHGCSPA